MWKSVVITQPARNQSKNRLKESHLAPSANPFLRSQGAGATFPLLIHISATITNAHRTLTTMGHGKHVAEIRKTTISSCTHAAQPGPHWPFTPSFLRVFFFFFLWFQICCDLLSPVRLYILYICWGCQRLFIQWIGFSFLMGNPLFTVTGRQLSGTRTEVLVSRGSKDCI